ncbi:thiopurine S-methyltransferase [Bowmanella denitrificans]|uniref:Thiopurine S-methyltransferase n=1 Tax=Bowmanella denitrificans TaxID=366582 RepID=A0ABN0WX71_9ALTE
MSMEAKFWQDKWQKQELGFHLPEPHPKLVRHLASLTLEPGDSLFLPLCGKSLDIAWLLSQGFRVTGAEWVQSAVEQLFAELGVRPQITELGQVKKFSADNLDIFVGDIFALHSQTLGPINAIYDRAALVALPPSTRRLYSQHLMALTGGCAPQLLISFDYQQERLAGPPFSVVEEEIRALYAEKFAISLLESKPIKDGLKGKCPADEQIWLLQPT